MKNFFSSIWKKVKRFVVIAFLLHLAYVVALIWVSPPVTLTMLANKIKGYKIIYEPIRFDKQGSNMKLAAIASEDQKFPHHIGLDFNAIKGAFEKNQEGKKIRGGSTITQQASKNVFFWQGRDWVRKGLETYASFLTELIWGKRKILEHYLNVAEMGEGVYGVQSAAKIYFGKKPENLSAEQAALIIASLPNPKKMNPNKPSSQLRRRQQWILRQMRNLATADGVQQLVSSK